MQTVDDLWANSTRRYRERREEENRWAWIHFYDRMHRLHAELLAAEYDARATALVEELVGTRVRADARAVLEERSA